jgi:pilus assembly protein FimV
MASKRDLLIASAEKSLVKGKADAALKDYLKVLEEAPGDINILNKVGDLFVRLNRNEESIPYYTRIAEHYSKDGFFLKAIAIYKKINRLDPARLDVYERLAELYARQGLTTEAKSQYQVLADYHSKNENVVGAIGIYQKMAMAEPQNIQLHVKLADLYTQSRRTPDALKEYATVAGLLRERGATGESIQVYEKALRIAPDNVEILRAFVPLLLEAGRLPDARGFVKRALDTTPRSVPLFLLAAEAALAAGDLTEARGFASKAQSVEPENADVLASVMRLQLQGGRPDLALPAAAALADLAMKRGEARRALGYLTPLFEKLPEDEALLQKLVHISTAAGDEASTVPYRSLLADIWKKKGRIADAAEALRFCARAVPGDSQFRARLSQLEPAQPVGETRPAGEALAPPPSPPPRTRSSASLDVTPAARVEAAGDEFILDFEDEQLIQDPGGTGPVPSPIRKLSSPEAPSPRGEPPPHVPPQPAFGVLDDFAEMAGEALHAVGAKGPKPAVPPPPSDATGPIERTAGPRWGSPMLGDVSVSLDDSDAPDYAEESEPHPEDLPPDAEILDDSAASIDGPLGVGEQSGGQGPGAGPEFLPAMGAQPPRERRPLFPETPAPAAAPQRVTTDAELDTALAEAEVFRKYGLWDKAIEQLSGMLVGAPGALALREKLFEIYLESGKKTAAVEQAEILKDRYRAQGRLDRERALDSLLVDRTSAEMGETSEKSAPISFLRTGPLTAPPHAETSVPEPAPPPATVAPPAATEAPGPSPADLQKVDFCLDQGMVVDASEHLQSLENRFPGHADVEARRARLEGSRGADEAVPPLREIFTEDFESVLDAELGRALTDEMARRGPHVPPPAEASARAAAGPSALDESSLFSDEQEFFNFAGELQSELNHEVGGLGGQPDLTVTGQEVSLEEIFREFKKGVEQQLSPEDYETHYNLGIAYKEMSLTDEAIGEFQRAAKDPLHAVECCSMLGLCFLEKGLPQLAIKWYRKGLETPGIREDDRLGLQYDLANVYSDLGDRENAYKTFLEIYGSNASFRDVHDRLKGLAPTPGMFT